MSNEQRNAENLRRYNLKRAAALDLQEREHDQLIERRFRINHGDTATGYKAFIVRKVSTDFAIRDANAGGSIQERA